MCSCSTFSKNHMKKKVLITGANGFVGKQILKTLVNENVDVVVVLRSGQPSPSDVSEIIFSDNIFSEDVEFWKQTFTGIDVIIHAAWYVEPGNYLRSSKNLDCLEGTLRMAMAAHQSGVRRFVGIGTCFEYDLSSEILTIETPILPTTPYAAAKASVWITLSNMLPDLGVEFVWCRLFFLTGENEDPRRLIPYLHRCLKSGEVAILSSGNQIVDYLDVAEAGQKISLAALGEVTGAINICSGIGRSVKEIALDIADIYARPDLLCFGGQPDRDTDPKIVVGLPNF